MFDQWSFQKFEERFQIAITFSVHVADSWTKGQRAKNLGHFLKLMDYVLAASFKSFNNVIAFESKIDERKKERKKSHNSHLF